jgi:DNA-binding NtrC family response regulator
VNTIAAGSRIELVAGLRPAASSAPGTAVLASADVSFRKRVRDSLVGMRWRVREAGGGAEALACFRAAPSEVLILDSWLPDLEIEEFVEDFRRLHPEVDLIVADQDAARASTIRSLRRYELLHALRQGQDTARGTARPIQIPEHGPVQDGHIVADPTVAADPTVVAAPDPFPERATIVPESAPRYRLPELIGNHQSMLEVSRRIRLVAAHSTPVLIEGPTGTGKELVARAIHRLSARSEKPFVALNCAAVPEPLFEAELFGHARGAFTGEVQRRTGRIEAAPGGTLLLDEIGEMPPSMQAKLLRFIECGELQRLGESRPVRVDVRIVAATNRSLAQLTREAAFRTDLYFRLAVFLIRTPPLSEHKEDIPLLVPHFLKKFGSAGVSGPAMEKLLAHSWPGSVRELEHVLERASIFAANASEFDADSEIDARPRGIIAAAEIEFAADPRNN